jgi:hypothetical protein
MHHEHNHLNASWMVESGKYMVESGNCSSSRANQFELGSDPDSVS